MVESICSLSEPCCSSSSSMRARTALVCSSTLSGLTGSYTAQEQHIAILYHAAHPAGAVKTLNFHRGSFSFRFCVFCISSLPQLPVRFNRMVFLNNKKQEQS